MQNITSTRGFNIGGIASLKVAPIEHITNLPMDDDPITEVDYALSFVSPHAWAEIIPEHEATEVMWAKKGTKAGNYYEFKLETVLNLIDAAKLTTLKEAGYYRMAVLLTDNNGVQLLVGTQYHGAIVSSSTTINPGYEGKGSVNLLISHEDEFGPRIYNPD